MKSIKLLAAALVLATPLVSFAQSNGPVTRESVRAELVQLEQAGYNPSGDQTQYPENIQAAEARLHAQDTAKASPSYGPAPDGTSQSGSPKRHVSILDTVPDFLNHP
jgi:hypothetical protein